MATQASVHPRIGAADPPPPAETSAAIDPLAAPRAPAPPPIDPAMPPTPTAAAADRPRPLRAALHNVPPLPPFHLPRPRQLLALRQQVMAIADQPLGFAAALALVGPPGIGKSVLAAALAADEDSRATYPDGIYWLTVGWDVSRLPRLQAQLLRMAGGAAGAGSVSTAAGRLALRHAFAGRRALIILDDVQRVDDVLAFDLADSPSRLALTCGDAALPRGLGATAHVVEPLREVPSLKLMARICGVPPGKLPGAASRVAELCGHRPLALGLAAGMARGEPDCWPALLKRLHAASPPQVQGRGGARPAVDDGLLSALIAAAIDDLGATRDYYFDLAVFAEAMPVPETAVEALWEPRGFTRLQCGELLDHFAGRRLVTCAEGLVWLHRLKHRAIRERATDLPARHARLVDGYALRCREGWWRGPDDGYFFTHLPHHLREAGRVDALDALLVDYRWLKAKLAATDIRALLDDYARSPHCGRAAALVGQALAHAAAALAADPRQLVGQLVGRLRQFKDTRLQALLEQAMNDARPPWFSPATPSLIAPTQTLEHLLSGHTDWVTSVAINAAATRAVSGAWDNTVRVWDLEAGGETHVLTGHTAPVTCLAESADGRRAVSGSRDKTVRVWDLEAGRQLHAFEGHTDWIRAVAISADGRRAVSAGLGRTVRVWDLEAGTAEHVFTGHTRRVNTVVMSADGRRALSAGSDMTVRVWDLETKTEALRLQGHTRRVNVAAISPDGRRAVTGSGDGTMRVWDLDAGEVSQVLAGHEAGVNALALESRGRRAISASWDNTVRVWDLETGKAAFALEGHVDRPRAVGISADGRRAVSAGDDRTVRVWDLDAGGEAFVFENHQGPIWSVAMSRDGRRALSASSDRTVRVWDLTTGRETFVFEGDAELVTPMAVSADGSRAVHAGTDRTVRVWDLNQRRELWSLQGHTARVTSVAVSADGANAVSASDDGTVRAWDLWAGRESRVLDGHQGAVTAVALNPTGRFAASVGTDGTVRGWDLASGAQVARLDADASLTAVAFSGDACIVATSTNGAVHILDLVA